MSNHIRFLCCAVVNCVQSHPFDCAVATSGIDNTIKVSSGLPMAIEKVVNVDKILHFVTHLTCQTMPC